MKKVNYCNTCNTKDLMGSSNPVTHFSPALPTVLGIQFNNITCARHLNIDALLQQHFAAAAKDKKVLITKPGLKYE